MKSKIVLADSCRLQNILPSKRGRRPQTGFTLLEVMIALVVLSFGMLGLAAMQLKGMQSAHHSYQRTLATVAAKDAVERLWIELWEDPDICPLSSSVLNGWQSKWSSNLPGMADNSVINSLGNCGFEVVVTWQDERFSSEGNVSRLVYVARLPQKL